MRSARLCAAVAVAGIIVALLLPLSPALSTGDVRQARFIGVVLTGIVCVAFGLSKVDAPSYGRRSRSSRPPPDSSC
jgi:hypothetical protein